MLSDEQLKSIASTFSAIEIMEYIKANQREYNLYKTKEENESKAKSKQTIKNTTSIVEGAIC